MKLPLVGGSAAERYAAYDSTRTINLYPVADPSGKEEYALYGTPGTTIDNFGFSTSVGRGIFNTHDDQVYSVAGDVLVRWRGGLGTDSYSGVILTTSGFVSFADNGVQLAVCDGTSLYILTYATDTFAKVTDPDLPASVGSVTFIDGYFVVNENDTGKFYISALYDGTSWASLDFATAESSPDDLLRVLNVNGQLFLFGKYTSEVWYNSGNSNFPFERISGGKLEVGILSPNTAIELDNSVFWVGQNKTGRGVVYRAEGFSAKRISNAFVERTIQQATQYLDVPDLKAYTYEEEGHIFYCITGEDLETTLCYDLTTGLWHERAGWNPDDGTLTPHIVNDVATRQGIIWCSSRLNGDLLKMSLDYYQDADLYPIVSKRIFPTISNEDVRQRYNQLVISMQNGVGTEAGRAPSNLEDATVNPSISLRISPDGGQSWSSSYSKPIGREGQYSKRVAFRRLGTYKQMTIELTISDVVRKCLIGAYLT